MKFPYRKIDAITPDIEPGFYRIDNDAYHAGPGLSSSRVKKALESWDIYNAQTGPSTALCFGRAFHAALLEPEVYADIPRIPGGNRTKLYMEAVQRGDTVICSDDAEIIPKMIDAIQSHPEYAKLGTPDPEIMGITRLGNHLVKCKADLFGSAIVDFKSTSGGVGPEFVQSVINFGYHISAAFYHDIIRNLTGESLPFILVPVTKSEPFECEFYRVPDEILEQGRTLYKAALDRIARWSAYSDRQIREKKIRTLPLNPRFVYSTQETIRFLEETDA